MECPRRLYSVEMLYKLIKAKFLLELNYQELSDIHCFCPSQGKYSARVILN